MRAVPIHEKREELRRVLSSKHFSRARKKSRFLRFVCEEAFAGKADELNEYLIGIEIYERGTEFNPHEDSIVRVQAHEIRRALKSYYSDTGRENPIRIDLPVGHYAPTFTRICNGAGAGVPQREEHGTEPRRHRGHLALTVGLGLLCVLLAGLVVLERMRGPAEAQPQWTTSYSPAMDWFWRPFLPPARKPLVVLPVHPILRAAHSGDSETTRNSGWVIPKKAMPEFRGTIHYEELPTFRFVPSTTDFTAVGEALGLLNLFELFASAGQTTVVKPARLVDFEQVREANTILLGGNQAWSGRVFLYQQGFWFHEGVIDNKQPRDGERALYRPEFDPVTNQLRKDYALILMLPNAKQENRILLLYGIYTQGSEAAIEFVTSPAGLEELHRALVAEAGGGSRPPTYFQALLETTVENAVPGNTTVVAVRAVPES